MTDSPLLWNRRRLLRTAGLAGIGLAAGPSVLAACSSGPTAAAPGGPTTAVRVALGWISNVEFAGFWIADDRGYYAQEGLEVEFITGGPNAPQPTATLAAGGAEIAIPVALQAYVSAITEGNDFLAYATMFQNAPSALLSLARRPVRTARDLVGARVLGQQGVQPYIDAAMTLAGVPTTYEFIPVGYEPSPLLEGQGDVYTCFATNQPITLEAQGLKQDTDFFVTTYESLGLPQYAGLLCSQRSWVAAHRDTVVRFMRATVRGWQDNRVDPAAAAALAVDDYGADLGLDLAQQTRENQLQIGFTESDLTRSAGLMRIDPARLAGPMFAAYRTAGVPLPPDAAAIIDTTVLDEVFAGEGDGVRPLDLLPKAHLHVHLEGAMRPSTLAELAAAAGLPMPSIRGFTSFAEFGSAYRAASALVRTEADLRRVVREVVADAADDGAVWVEPHFYPTRYAGALGTEDAVLEIAIDEGRAAAAALGIGCGIMVSALRDAPLAEAVGLAGLAARYADAGVVSFGLAADEALFGPEPFAPAFRIARDAGLISAPHAGELVGPSSVRGALDALGAQRICHGVRSVEDPALVDRLAADGIVLDVCPTSNVALRVVGSVAEHPLPRLLAAGVRCTLNGDDPLLFGPGVLGEYELARTGLGLPDELLAGMARTSIEASGAPRGIAAAGVDRIDAWLAAG